MAHEVSKRKARGALSPKAGLLISALAAAALLAAVLLWLLPSQDALNVTSLPEAAERPISLSERKLGEIQSVRVFPSVGESYTFIVRDDSLVLDEHEDYSLRGSVIEAVVNNICHVRAERVILDTKEKAVHLAAFGLNPAAFSALITYVDGSTDSVRVGNQIQGDEIPYYYFMWNGDSRIFAGGTDLADAFNVDYASLRSVEQPVIHTDILTRIEIFADEDLTLEYTDLGWLVTSPLSYPASPSFMKGFLQNVENLLFSRYLGSSGEIDPEVSGLCDPPVSVVLTEGKSVLSVPDTEGNVHTFDIPEKAHRLHLGGAYDDVSYYAEYDGGIYTVSYIVYNLFHDFDSDTLRDLNPFRIDLYQIGAIEILQGAERTVYSLSFEVSSVSSGADTQNEILYECHVRKDGLEIDAQAFQQWYQSAFYDFLPEGSILSPIPRDASPELTVVISNDYAKRTVEFIRYDPLHLAVRVDGSAYDYVSETVCERFLPPAGI